MKNSMTKRIISLLLLWAFLLSACGAGQNPTSATTSAPGTSSEAPAPQTEPESTVTEAPSATEAASESFLEREAGTRQLTLYWKKPGADISKCDVWIWWEGKEGEGVLFTPCAYGFKCQVNVPEQVSQVGFIVRTGCSDPGGKSWGNATKDFESDRFAQLEGEETFIYLLSGDGNQYKSKDGGATLENIRLFSMAGIVSSTEIQYFISPAARLKKEQIKVRCEGKEVDVQALSSENNEVITGKIQMGEALDIIIGNRPLQDVKDDEKKEKVQAFTLKLLKEQYGIEEKDFLSAELEIVPAGEAREAGLDRSMVLGYGQDDRVCAFSSLEAILEVQDLKRTGCCILVDKEEIGSVGATGMQSRFFENAVAELLALTTGAYNDLILRRCLANSRMLSSDVSSAFDPTYAASFDKKNVAYLGHGMVFNKFTGARGKSGSNDANAEYLGFIRKVMDDAGVTFQTAELGKVDLGGGGTIAYILSLYGMNVIDCGVPVLNMHAPHEATSKADLYEAKCGYKAFLEA